jgi:hypothetical protein
LARLRSLPLRFRLFRVSLFSASWLRAGKVESFYQLGKIVLRGEEVLRGGKSVGVHMYIHTYVGYINETFFLHHCVFGLFLRINTQHVHNIPHTAGRSVLLLQRSGHFVPSPSAERNVQGARCTHTASVVKHMTSTRQKRINLSPV